MPFFIPFLIGASLLSMIPSFMPQEEKRAQEVIKQDGNQYFTNQTMRTGNPSFNNQMLNASGRDPYSIVQSNKGTAINAPAVQKWIIYGGVAIVALITLKFLMGRR
jgi:hypothetical protein